MDGNVSQFTDFPCQKQDQTFMGFFQFGVRYQATTDELRQYLRFSGRPGRVLEKDFEGKSGKI
jgi:hypothetical protein